MKGRVALYGFGGGSGGSGAALTVNAPAGVTVTVSKDGKSKNKTANSSGIAVFKGLSTGEWTVTITDGEKTASKPVTIIADFNKSITFFSATIHVTYPAGSTCTATDGVTTLTAPDTSGTWDCVVPNAGTWTLGYDAHPIDAVEITENGQEESITLGLYLFKSGVGIITPIVYDSQADKGVTVATDKITFAYSENSKAMSYIYNESKIDITNYKTLNARINCKTIHSTNNYKGRLFASNKEMDISPIGSNALASKILTVNSEIAFYSLDIANLTGEAYVGVHGAWKGELYDLWLE